MTQQEIPELAFGPYKLIEKLGAGAAGAVYLARHSLLDQPYAVKVLHEHYATDPRFTARFLREAKLAARLNHPNIVGVVTADHHEHSYYLVMEYIEGPTLEDLVVQEGPLNPRRAVDYVRQILDALVYAHGKGVFHRDIKAENVLIDPRDRARLVDFGLVMEVEQENRLTADNAVLGTPYYMPLEQWMSDPVDERADLYSTGVLLYYLLTGRFPFPGDSPIQVLHRLNSDVHDPLGLTVDPSAGLDERAIHQLERILDCALAKNREKRFSSARRFSDALASWLANTDEATQSTRTRQSVTTPSRGARGVEAREDAMQKSPNLETAPVEIAEGTFWVGKRPKDEIFYANPYLRVFAPRGSEYQPFNLIIDPGSSKDFSVVQSKVNQVIGDVKNLSSVFINHQDPDVGSSVGLLLGRYTPNAHVLCTEDTWRLVHYYNIPRDRFVALEKYARGIRLPSGNVVLPVPSPFCHFVGAMMLYDPQTRVLFSGDLFGGLTDKGATGLYADESDWTGMRAFHQIYMPTQKALQHAIDNIRRLDPPVEIIAPQHGRVIQGEYVQEFMERLYNLPVGLDILSDRNASDEELQAWTTVLARIVDVARSALGDEVATILSDDPNLSGHVTINGSTVTIANLGKTSVEQAVRILCDKVPHATANSIKYEAVFASQELGLPTPAVELDEDGPDDSDDQATGTEPAGFHAA